MYETHLQYQNCVYSYFLLSGYIFIHGCTIFKNHSIIFSYLYIYLCIKFLSVSQFCFWIKICFLYNFAIALQILYFDYTIEYDVYLGCCALPFTFCIFNSKFYLEKDYAERSHFPMWYLRYNAWEMVEKVLLWICASEVDNIYSWIPATYSKWKWILF